MSIGGNPLNFGTSAPGQVEGANPFNEVAPQVPDFLGVPMEASGAHIGEGFFHGLTAAPVAAGRSWLSNKISPTPEAKWRTGAQIKADYYQLGLNLKQDERFSPESEAFLVQHAADSRYRQSIIEGSAEAHPFYNTNVLGGGMLLGGLSDPIFFVPNLFTGGTAGTEAGLVSRIGGSVLEGEFKGLVGQGAAGMYRAGLIDAATAQAVAKPLTGVWGSRAVEGAAHGSATMAAAHLASDPFRQSAGMQEASPEEVWGSVLGGAVIGGISHPALGWAADKMGWNTNSPRVQGKVNKTLADLAEHKLAGLDTDPEVILAKNIAPEVESLGKVMDAIDKRPVDHGSLRPDELAPAPEAGKIKLSPAPKQAPTFNNPVDNMTETSHFGPRQAPKKGASTHHQGVDLGGTEHSPVHPAAPGRVVFSGVQKGYGNIIVVEHAGEGGKPIFTAYAHMENLGKAVGDTVGTHDELGRVGKTGNVTGAHLHFEVRETATGGQIDPEPFIKGRRQLSTEGEVATSPSAPEAVPTEIETVAQEVANHPDVELVSTPEERAMLRATDAQDVAGLMADQIKRVRESVVEFGTMISSAVEDGIKLEGDDVEFSKLRKRVNGAITSMKQQLGDSAAPETASLIKDMGGIVKKLSSQDPEQVKAALADLAGFDDKLQAAGVLTHEDIAKQHAALVEQLESVKRGLPRASKEETIKELTDRKAQLEEEIAKVESRLPKDYLLSDASARIKAPMDVKAISELVGGSANLSGKELGIRKSEVLAAIGDRINAIQDWHRSVSPVSGDIINKDARLFQQYTEEMAAGGAKTPAQFLEEQNETLADLLKQVKDTPGWEEGSSATKRLEKMEEAHAAAETRAKAFEKGAKQALSCGLSGELS
jgi:hypothetical protein